MGINHCCSKRTNWGRDCSTVSCRFTMLERAFPLFFPHSKESQALKWNQLLSAKRVKGLFGQQSSVPISGDLRSEFDRDYGRTVFSTPVRRLQDKAQVFPLERHDAVRTRLTHSMEVSSVARGLGKKAASWLLEQKAIE